MQFWLFRVSINASRQSTLFPVEFSPQSRFQALSNAMSQSITGGYRNKKYSLFNLRFDGDTVFGRISKPATIDRTVPSDSIPDTLVDIEEETNAWAHFAFFGVSTHAMVVQRKSNFFSGGADGMAEILKAVITTGLQDSRYEVEVYPIPVKGEFWSFVKEIASLDRVEFEFVAPNMLGGVENFAPVLEYSRSVHNANNLKLSISNSRGDLLFPRNEITESEVSYVERGGGKWSVYGRTADGAIITAHSDRESALVVEVDDEDVDDQDGGLRRLWNVLRDRFMRYL